MFYVYILASQQNGTLYLGHTDDLGRRMFEHKNEVRKGFTSKYGVHKLVWFEEHETRENAFIRERQIKKWKRVWKIRLIETSNPHWIDIMEQPVWPANHDWSRADIFP